MGTYCGKQNDVNKIFLYIHYTLQSGKSPKINLTKKNNNNKLKQKI
jgi:hypothetical protein